jgi:hypothetical protein
LPPTPTDQTRGMTIKHDREPLTTNRIAAAALAALGAASAIPIPLAQLDFAGLFDAFNIDSGDSPRALLVIAGVGGILTIAVVALAFAGAALALTGAPSARSILIAASLGGLVTAMPLWIPAGVVIGVAALILGQAADRHGPIEKTHRNLLRTSCVTTCSPKQGEA